MKKRYKMSKRSSKRKFRKTVGLTHRFNFQSPIMRGGIRL